jgi:hypothetical protein
LPQASKFFELKALADLLAEELKSKETKWPKGAVTFEELRQIRREAGMPSGDSSTHEFLAGAKKAGKVEVLEGVVRKGKKYVRATKYLFS